MIVEYIVGDQLEGCEGMGACVVKEEASHVYSEVLDPACGEYLYYPSECRWLVPTWESFEKACAELEEEDVY